MSKLYDVYDKDEGCVIASYPTKSQAEDARETIISELMQGWKTYGYGPYDDALNKIRGDIVIFELTDDLDIIEHV